MKRKFNITGAEKTFNINNPVIDKGVLYGVFKNESGKLKINNRVYELLIYDYMTSKIETLISTEHFNFRDHFITWDNRLDVAAVLLKFQEFMRHEYSRRDKAFLERNGRLIFMVYV